MEHPFTTRKHGWIKDTEVWFKWYCQVDLRQPGEENVIERLKQYFVDHDERAHGKAHAWKRYREAKYMLTRK